ncbi:MAG: signal peptidase I [Pseudomonadota bacterium]
MVSTSAILRMGPSSARPAWRRTLVAGLRTVALALVLALGVRIFVAEPFSIPTTSMLPALLPGEHLLVLKYPYGYGGASLPWVRSPGTGRVGLVLPARGDAIVFADPADGGSNFVKRVVGLPGEVVAISNGVVSIDGIAATRTRLPDFAYPASADTACRPGRQVGDTCVHRRDLETLPGAETAILPYRGRGADYGPVTVPEGHLFVLGDNRGGSLDSRFGITDGGFGHVPLGHVIGRAGPIFYSRGEDGIRWDRLGARP